MSVHLAVPVDVGGVVAPAKTNAPVRVLVHVAASVQRAVRRCFSLM